MNKLHHISVGETNSHKRYIEITFRYPIKHSYLGGLFTIKESLNTNASPSEVTSCLRNLINKIEAFDKGRSL